ncbi:unnamed protein product, partial [Iphiclides podalirius]
MRLSSEWHPVLRSVGGSTVGRFCESVDIVANCRFRHPLNNACDNITSRRRRRRPPLGAAASPGSHSRTFTTVLVSLRDKP